MISQTTEYALRAVVWLAANPEKPLTAQQIADATRVPAGYLAKVLQGLSRAGLLHSQRGLGGGFTLAKSPTALTMWEVVQAVDPLRRIDGCPLGFEAHGEELCPLHKQLDETIAMIERSFTACKISKLIDPTSASSPLCAYVPPKAVGATAKAGRRAKRP
ncbi:MAG: Rrf2 family transcriptional regulator [Phycisphaerales bacterium]|nr:Rrf2 family transcriptional regulator [Phycisphaerales bacterium]